MSMTIWPVTFRHGPNYRVKVDPFGRVWLNGVHVGRVDPSPHMDGFVGGFHALPSQRKGVFPSVLAAASWVAKQAIAAEVISAIGEPVIEQETTP